MSRPDPLAFHRARLEAALAAGADEPAAALEGRLADLAALLPRAKSALDAARPELAAAALPLFQELGALADGSGAPAARLAAARAPWQRLDALLDAA